MLGYFVPSFFTRNWSLRLLPALLLLRELPHYLVSYKTVSITCPIAQSVQLVPLSPLYLKRVDNTSLPYRSDVYPTWSTISLESSAHHWYVFKYGISACFFLPCALGSLGALAASSSFCRFLNIETLSSTKLFSLNSSPTF